MSKHLSRLTKAAYVMTWLLALAGPVLSSGCSVLEMLPKAGASGNGPNPNSGASTKVLSADWVQTTKVDFQAGALERVDIISGGDGEVRLAASAGKYALAGTYTSTVKEAAFPFNALGIEWKADIPDRAEVIGEVRTSADGKNYTDWLRAAIDGDAQDRSDKGTYVSELVVTPSHRWVQYRLLFKTRDAVSSPAVSEVTVTFIDSTRGPDLSKAKAAAVRSKVAGQPTIIPRSGWGADESLRFKNGEEIWPPERSPALKIIVHHTVTQNDDPNPPATIRAILRYHAARLGWGDIGYNYIIDAEGNIYEGRFGGDDVAAGHAKQYNSGTVGISVLGDYNATGLSSAAKSALVNLISWSVLRNGIDPNGSSYLVDKDFPNISGHRDALPTSCPGDFLERELPDIRSKVASQIPLYGVKWGSHSTPPVMQPKQTLSVKIAPSNRGRKVWVARGEGVVRLGYRWYRSDGSQVVQSQADDKRTELPKDLGFGQSVTIDALITAPEEPGTYRLKWDMVHEGVTWFGDRSAAPLEIVVNVGQAEQKPSPSPTAVPSASPTPASGIAQYTWYFAEGSTTKGYQTNFQLMNPNPDPASVVFTFMTESGATSKFNFSVKAMSRLTVNANELRPNVNMATRIDSDREIYAERTVLFGHDGHASQGTTGPAATWYFAEGSTGWGFSTWLLLMNPNDTEANVAVTFIRETGSPIIKEFRIKPTSRLNVYANKEAPNANVAMKVAADKPIVAERSVYIDGGKGGHGSMGTTNLSQTWLFAEGFTGPGVSTWLLLANPNNARANVKVSFIGENGATTVKTYTLPAVSRQNINVNQVVLNAAVAMKVEADVPVVAERSMYFTGGKGTHNTVGASKAARTWHFPEGYTGKGVGNWILIFNPESAEANISLTFMQSDGTTSEASAVVGPLSRHTIYLNRLMPNTALSTRVESSRPVVVEMAIYFNNGEGGTVSLGIPTN